MYIYLPNENSGSFKMRHRRSLWLIFIAAAILFITIFLYYAKTNTGTWDPEFQPVVSHDRNHPFEIPKLGHLSPHDLSTPLISEKTYRRNCFNEIHGKSIEDIYGKIQLLKTNDQVECKEILFIFNNIFDFDLIESPLVLPEKFQPKVKSWLGNDDHLFEDIKNQKVYKIVFKLTGEESIYNPLRAKRPQSKTAIDPLDYIKDLIKTSEENCDFCRYKDFTAEDVFGRIENTYSASGSNLFKLAKFHGLFLPLQHSPFNISFDAMRDLFMETSQGWFRKAYLNDPSHKYPTLLWDSMPHGGASQVHPHIHGLLDKKYQGFFEILHKAAGAYYLAHQRSLWTDYILVHWALGLVVRKGTAFALTPLNARKDHEFFIISSNLNESFVQLLHRILDAYPKILSTYCFSGAGVYPPMDATNRDGLPVIWRIGSRGDCTNIRSDVSSLELYAVNNINSNMEETLSALKQTPEN